jgi:tetratricopeptide (TPR) repeat protein
LIAAGRIVLDATLVPKLPDAGSLGLLAKALADAGDFDGAQEIRARVVSPAAGQWAALATSLSGREVVVSLDRVLDRALQKQEPLERMNALEDVARELKEQLDLVRRIEKTTGEVKSEPPRRPRFAPSGAQDYLERGMVRYSRDDFRGALGDLGKAAELDPSLAEEVLPTSAAICENLTARLGIRVVHRPGAGLTVEKVDGESPAGRAGVRESDVIVNVNSQEASPEALALGVAESWPGGMLEVDIARGGERVRLKIPAPGLPTTRGNDPSQAAVYTFRGRAKMARKDVEGALREFTMAIELDPQCLDAYFHRAEAWLERGDNQAAVADYSKAIELDPSAARTWYGRGFCRILKDDFKAAIGDLSRAIELDPTDAPFYYWRAFAQRELNDLDAAAVDYTRAIDLDPGDSDAYEGRASMRRRKGDLEGAESDSSAAIRLRPGNATAYAFRGVVLQERGDLPGAIGDFSKCVELDPKGAFGHRYRGYLRYFTGAKGEALTDLRRACELDPANLDYPQLYIYLIRAVKEDIAAAQELKDYLGQRKSDDPHEWYPRLAGFLCRTVSGDELLKAAESKDEEVSKARRCEAFFYIGSMALLLGNKENARYFFEKCLETGMTAALEYVGAKAEIEALDKGR